MSSPASASAPYGGASGTTRTTPTTIPCASCDTWYGARYHLSIRLEPGEPIATSFLDDGFSAVNRTECPNCGGLYVVEEPIVIHDVAGRRLFLVVPESQRHRTQQHRAALLESLTREEVPTVAGYVFEPVVTVGLSRFKRALRGATAAPPEQSLTRPLAAVIPPRTEDVPFDSDADDDGPEPVTSVSPEPSLSPRSRTVTPEPPRPVLPPPPVARLGLPEVPAVGPSTAGRSGGLPRLPVAAPVAAPVSTSPLPTVVSGERETLDRSVDVALESTEASVDVSTDTVAPPTPAEISTQVKVRPAAEGAGRASGLLIDALGRRTEPDAAPVPSEAGAAGPAAARGAAWDQSLDAGWALDSGEAAPNEDPTHVVRADQIHPATRNPTGPHFDEARASGRDTYLRLDERRVQAAVRLSAARANAFHTGDAALGVQYHQTPAGPIVDLILTLREGGELVDHVYWLIEPDAPGVSPLIDTLQRDFVVDVVLHLPDGAFHGRRTFHEPLGSNLRSAVVAWRAASPGTDPAAARRAFEAADFDRVGRLKHNFHADSFVEIRSAAEAQLALGILSYWSAPERRDYLLRIKSLPESWLETIARRVLQAALDFGLSMEPHLRQRAIELKIADGSAALVKASLANFAEVCLNLKPNDLDPLDVWGNWESLLALADELDVRVDEELEELAALAMERAREASQANESAELGADDAGVELVEIGELGNMGSAALAGLLDNPNLRTDAALALLHRGDAGHAISIADAMRRMTREQLQRVVPAALALGPAFEGAFLGALRSKRASLRLAAALFLAEIRSERAVGPLLELVLRGQPDEWQYMARAAARMGRRIIAPAVRTVATDGDPDGRIAFALALLGTEARGALSAARDRESDPRVHGCLDRAMERAAEVSFGDPADFSERLGDAFQNCRSDAVGPDFDEDLESVDIGPAASIKDLETDVDLDGLDDPKPR
ncbi:CpXC domain-containing protein [Myxococcota bacterium]|nr:CpXC domain-containing protein [Myxococcota bacterium]